MSRTHNDAVRSPRRSAQQPSTKEATRPCRNGQRAAAFRHGALLCTLLLMGVACDSQPSGAPARSASAAAATAPSPSSAAPKAAAAKPLKNANPKAYKHTEEQALGTLPEGVGIAVGQKAPDFELADAKGSKINLKDFVAQGPALLVFYRGGW